MREQIIIKRRDNRMFSAYFRTMQSKTHTEEWIMIIYYVFKQILAAHLSEETIGEQVLYDGNINHILA